MGTATPPSSTTASQTPQTPATPASSPAPQTPQTPPKITTPPATDDQTAISQGPPAVEASVTPVKTAPTQAPNLTKTFVLGSRGPRLYGVDPSTADGKKRVAEALEEYIIVQPQTPGAAFNYRVLCRECGWQTHCVVLESGRGVVRDHAVRHLYQI